MKVSFVSVGILLLMGFPYTRSTFDHRDRDFANSFELSRVADPGNCAKGWIPFGSKCYLFSSNTSRLKFDDASRHCEGEGATLVTIPSEREQKFLLSRLSDATTNVWIGITRRPDRSLGWTDGTPLRYTNWIWGQPNLNGGSTVEILTGTIHVGHWNQAPRNKLRQHICEKQRDPSLPMPDVPPREPECQGVVPGSFSYRSSCYRLGSYQNWDTAEANCLALGGHLASVRDAFADAFFPVRFKFRGGLVWIGLQDTKGSGRFTWSDGWPVHYTNWAILQPGAAEKDQRRCVAMDLGSGSWSIKPCGKALPYLCHFSQEKPPDVKHHEGPCPDQAKNWLDVGNSYCYSFMTQKENFESAVQFCEKQNATLPSFHSSDELNRLLPYIRKAQSNLWIGLVQGVNETYEWLDGTALNFENWKTGEPSSTDERCTEIRHFDALWNDATCSVKNQFICAAPKDVVSTEEDGSDSAGGGISAAAAVSIGLFFLILVPVTGVAVREYRKRRQGPPANASFDNVMYLEEKKKESISMTPPSANNTA